MGYFKKSKHDIDNDESYSAAQTKLFRADKSTHNRDDFKVLMVGIFIAVMIMVLPLFQGKAYESRWFRDLVSLTPFSKVEVHYQAVLESSNKMIVGGVLQKDQCEFNTLIDNPVAYVTGQFGLRHRLVVDTSPEDAITGVIGGSRPPSDGPETWGPWLIDASETRTFGEIVEPVKWEIYTFHIKCPQKPIEQVNLFAEGEWVNFTIPRETPVVLEED